MWINGCCCGKKDFFCGRMDSVVKKWIMLCTDRFCCEKKDSIVDRCILYEKMDYIVGKMESVVKKWILL